MADWLPMSWQYVAGFFDGEGSVLCKHGVRTGERQGQQYRLFRLAMYQNSREVLDEISDFLTSHNIESSVLSHTRPDRVARGHAGSYMLTVNGAANVMKALLPMLPHLRVKREKAMDALLRLYELMEMAEAGELTHYTHQRYADLREVFSSE